ncbi:MAG: quinolinate synthase NadA [Candidatus Omnitrophica bacterium]|nr:quinolinate synthase NadA [Candidatus Omnitrophota bacterium]
MEHQDKGDVKYNETLKKKIEKLKKKRNAVIIVHNYQRDEIQEIADISGDSLALSQAAVRTDADVIVFCGVRFMAESASILNPDKKVLLPVMEAGCPLADMITPEKLRAKKKEYPKAAVVCYVNSSAEVKAESDIACTSSNAVEVVRSLLEKEIIFVPDKNLGRYVQTQLPGKKIILWEGFCPTHIRVQEEDMVKAKKEHPAAEVIAHPECNPEVLALSDHICSTGGMFTYVKKSPSKEFIISTESGMLYQLRKDNLAKKFCLPTENLVCANMKLITLGWVAHSLEKLVYEIKVSDVVREKAKRVLERMLAVTGEKKGTAIAGVLTSRKL